MPPAVGEQDGTARLAKGWCVDVRQQLADLIGPERNVVAGNYDLVAHRLTSRAQLEPLRAYTADPISPELEPWCVV